MGFFRKKQQPDAEAETLKAFLDMIAPAIVRFETGYFICGNTFRCVWALREYPTSTDDLAILRHLGEKHGVTLHIYTRMVSALEERRIVHNAEIRNRMKRGSSQNLQQAVEAESNLQDVADLIGSLHRNKEPLLHCAVYIEMIAGSMQDLQILQTNVEVELMRSKLNVDKLKLRQQAGFCAVSPVGYNSFGTEYERVLPASSVANLFPFNYSGKTDRKGFYIGKDKFGSNIVVDFDQRDEDKTSANVLILGNSGQGKSYLMKLLLLNFLEAGKSVITLDVEHEQWELCQNVGGCFADIVEGTYKINLLEPRCWDTDADPYDLDAPKAFRQSTRLAQHTSFLKDVFRSYKDFTTAQIDTIEIMLTKLYAEWGITEETDFSQMRPEDYPILSTQISDPSGRLIQKMSNFWGSLHCWVLAAVFAPIVLIAAILCSAVSGGADHNNLAVEASFYGTSFTENIPAEFRTHITDMQTAFSLLDSAVAEANAKMEDGNRLDPLQVKAIFYAVFFGEDAPSRRAADRFVDCFFRAEERTRIVVTEQEDGTVTTAEETYTATVPVSLETAYVNLSALFGQEITKEDKENAAHIYTMIAGNANGSDGTGGAGGSIQIDYGTGSGSRELDTSTFTNPAGKNADDLVQYALHAYEEHWGYVWGTFGCILTEGLFEAKLAQYPDALAGNADFIRANWVGGRTTDCVGLIKGYGWLDAETQQIVYNTNGMPDITANEMYHAAIESGTIDTIPEILGLAVWHDGHIGVYIGGGEVVEAMGTRYGVVKTKLAGARWTHWLKIPYISYD